MERSAFLPLSCSGRAKRLRMLCRHVAKYVPEHPGSCNFDRRAAVLVHVRLQQLLHGLAFRTKPPLRDVGRAAWAIPWGNHRWPRLAPWCYKLPPPPPSHAHTHIEHVDMHQRYYVHLPYPTLATKRKWQPGTTPCVRLQTALSTTAGVWNRHFQSRKLPRTAHGSRHKVPRYELRDCSCRGQGMQAAPANETGGALGHMGGQLLRAREEVLWGVAWKRPQVRNKRRSEMATAGSDLDRTLRWHRFSRGSRC